MKHGPSVTMRTLVISKRPVLRAAISMILMSRWQCTVTEAEDVGNASQVARKLNVSLVVVDIDERSASRTSRLIDLLRPAKLLTYGPGEHVASKSWAHVPDEASIDSLLAAVGSLFPDQQVGRRRTPLTRRQLEVITLAAAGRSNGEIALMLFLSTGTVKRHLHDAYARLEVRSRHEAATVLASWRSSEDQSRPRIETVSLGT